MKPNRTQPSKSREQAASVTKHGENWKDSTSLTEWQASNHLMKAVLRRACRNGAGSYRPVCVPLILYQCSQVPDIRVVPDSVPAGRTARV